MITDSKQKKNSEPTGLSKIQALRREALTVLYAKHAAERQDVMDFRSLNLKKGLLVAEEVPVWISRQEEKVTSTSGLPPQDLLYAVPNPVSKGTWDIHSVLVSTNSDLGWLARLSEDLAGEYAWTEYRATTFVLTGIKPPVVNAIVRYTDRSTLSSANRIELVLDPALTDKEVAALYRQVRRRMLKKDSRGKARFRQLSKKHLRLAIFDAEHEEKYLKKMHVWNKQFPKWKYEHLSNFIRDCKKARQRLIQPDYFD